MAVVVLCLSALLSLVWITRHLKISRTFKEDPILKPDSFSLPDGYEKLVSIIIPARNEEENIRECLMSVIAISYAAKEIIVVDDRSEDRTARIVEEIAREHPEVRLVRVTSLREGWTGKTSALCEGVKNARGDWFLFVDADTRHHPRTLDVVLGFAEEKKLDLVTLLPKLASHSFWERLMQPLLGGALMIRFPLDKVNDDQSPVAFANGQYILVRREAYNKVGGHEAVAGEMLEDIAIAKVFKANGLRIATAYGADIFTTRMYRSFSDICNGWARIYYFGLDRSLARVFAGVMLIVGFSLLPYVFFFWTLWGLLARPFDPLTAVAFGLNALTVALIAAALWRVFALTKAPRAFIPLYPIGAILSVIVKFKALALRFSRKGVRWRGTTYYAVVKGGEGRGERRDGRA